MYYLLRENGFISLLNGSLKNGVICKKEGGIFRSKWVPILSTVQLERLGILEKVQHHLKTDEEGSIFSDSEIMSCAYRPGANPDGAVLDSTQLIGGWLRASGIGEVMGLGEKRSAINAYSLNVKVGSFVEEAEYELKNIGPEISPEKFNEVMTNAFQKSSLPKEIEWQAKHNSWRR
jgi:hypothetical protein